MVQQTSRCRLWPLWLLQDSAISKELSLGNYRCPSQLLYVTNLQYLTKYYYQVCFALVLNIDQLYTTLHNKMQKYNSNNGKKQQTSEQAKLCKQCLTRYLKLKISRQVQCVHPWVGLTPVTKFNIYSKCILAKASNSNMSDRFQQYHTERMFSYMHTPKREF